MTLDIAVCIFSLCCIILGVIIHHGKFNKYLIGYHNLSEKEKKNVTEEDLNKISRGYKILFFAFAFIWLAGLFAFRYFEIYHYFNKYFFTSTAVWGFTCAALGVYTSYKLFK